MDNTIAIQYNGVYAKTAQLCGKATMHQRNAEAEQQHTELLARLGRPRQRRSG